MSSVTLPELPSVLIERGVKSTNTGARKITIEKPGVYLITANIQQIPYTFGNPIQFKKTCGLNVLKVANNSAHPIVNKFSVDITCQISELLTLEKGDEIELLFSRADASTQVDAKLAGRWLSASD